MPATPDKIPSDLALEISASYLPPGKFLRAVGAFFGLVEEVTKSLAGEDTVEWMVLVREGSQIVGLQEASYTVPPPVLEAIKDRVRNGMEALESESKVPRDFSEAALKYAHDLANVVPTRAEDDTIIRLWVKRKATVLTHRVVVHTAELLKVDYQDYGTVEGRLRVVADRDRGTLQFTVRDPVTHKGIRCLVGDDLLQDILAAFRKRVEVEGLIRYRRDGTPISIKVERVVAFPEAGDLPSFTDIKGLLRDAT